MPAWGDLQEDQLRFMAGSVPEAVAYRELGRGASITFAEWHARSNRVARGLVARGIGHGDRVALYVPGERALDWIVAYAAIHKAGAVAVPTSTRLSERELEVVLGHAGARAILTAEELRDGAAAVRRAVRSITLRSDAPFDDLAAGEDETDFQVPTSTDDLADIVYTSGTTGTPKGVAVRHRNVATIPNHEPRWTGEGWLHAAPLFTFAGIAFVYAPMKLGMTALYLPRFDAGRWIDVVERDRPTMAFLVPAMAELLVGDPRFAAASLDSLSLLAIGSAPLAPRTLRTLQDRLPGASVSNSYGMTEAGPAFLSMPREESGRRIGSVGRPQPPVEIRIVDDRGTDLPPGEVGELWTRVPGRQREYFGDPEATAATWTPDGWLRSGDLGRVDEDGFLYLVGRRKDLIIRGGHNVYPADVEAVLLEHPAVQEAAVAGVPHGILGEDVAAWIVARPGAVPPSDEELHAHCAELLADYKRPRRITWVEALPRNPTGKVLKHLLR